MARLLYKPIGLLFSVIGGLVASAIFKRIWQLAADGSEAPKATDERPGWGQVATAAAAQGAVYGGVKALVDRAGGRIRAADRCVAGADQDLARSRGARREMHDNPRPSDEEQELAQTERLDEEEQQRGGNALPEEEDADEE